VLAKPWSPSPRCLRDAFRHDQFSLVFQPQLNLAEGSVCGAEVLVRWLHPEHGVLLPNRFLPLLAQTAFDWWLDDLVLIKAVQAQVDLQAAGIHLPLSINLSPRQLLHSDFLASLTSIAARYPTVSLTTLEFELLESEPLFEVERAAEVMHQAIQLGVRFALDDFGAGHASLLRCHQLPVSKLKIDKSFTGFLMESPSSERWMQRTLEVAQLLELTVIAEGVERCAQKDRLLQLGCPQGQGYLFARPMPQAAFIDWLRLRRLQD